jgi:hypothetical protein
MTIVIEKEIHLKRLILATKTPDCNSSSENIVWVRASIADWLLEKGETKELRLVRFFDDEEKSFKWRYEEGEKVCTE